MEFGILGPLEVRVDGRPIAVTAPKPRTLLAALLVHANKVVAVAQLIDLLWGEDPPASAKATLQSHVLQLRRLLPAPAGSKAGGGVLLTRSPGYLLLVEPDSLDLDRFQKLVNAAQQHHRDGDPAQAATRLRQALGLWRGPALCDVDSDTLRWVEAPRLEELRLAALEARIDAELELGWHARLVGELRALVATHLLRERFAEQLMLALYRSGRQAEALEVFTATRRRLVEDLGLEPEQDLQRLHRAILAGDPALNHPATNNGRSGLPPRPPQPVPRELPGPIVEFTGRTREFQRLTRLLDATTNSAGRPVVISAIDGMGGIGKSALAIQAANQLTDRFPDGQLYVNLHGATPGQLPRAPISALGQLLRSLGLDPAAIPAEVEEAAVRWRSLAAQRRLLILLDNAHSAAQVRPLLPGSPTCAVLVTSRQVLGALGGVHLVHLDLLPHQQALALLARLIGWQRVAAEPAAAKEVVRLCGRLPLAIRIAGARLADRPTWPVGELADRLTDASRRLDELTTEGLAVRAAFDVSLQALQRSLDPVDRGAAGAFGLLSLPDGPDLGIAGAARLLDQPEQTTQSLLERLVDAHLLQTSRPGRYQFHDLLRLHARQHATHQQPEQQRLDALTRLFGYYAATAWHTLALIRPRDHRLATADRRWTDGAPPFASVLAALCWLEAERANLLSAITQAAQLARVIPAELPGQLARALHGFFSVRSYWQDCARANQTTLELAVRTGDRDTQAHALNDLGVAHEFLGRYQQAVTSHQHSLAIRRQLGLRQGQAASLNNLGHVHERLGHYQEAATCLQESLAINRALGHRRGQAASLGNLGMVYQGLGRCQKAIASLQESLRIFADLGECHGVASIQSDLGRVYERVGRHQEAATSLQESLATVRELGDRGGQADSLNNLGRVYQRLGRYKEAIASQQQSLRLARELNDPHDQVEALRDLGDALVAAGRSQHAPQAWQEALTICEALQMPQTAEVRQRLASPQPI
jgi:DNA-binding SARP family transcriptional activator/tetratricopeptide (TPR) repeat protein